MNILIVIDSLRPGGAETHVLSLCKCLTNDGHKVTLAAPYGKLLSLLDRKTDYIPLSEFSKAPLSLLKSAKELKKVIKKGAFDVIHSHARLPSLVLSAVHGNIPVVVTAHAIFNMNGINRLSYWGKCTICVSRDISDHLLRQCPSRLRRVVVINNGIDSDHFAPTNKRDFNTVIFVSRLDHDCSLAALTLCRIAGRLRAEFDGLKIIIVGGGDMLHEIELLADIMNSAIGDKVITCVGSVCDSYEILSRGGVFVGVSRAAMEASSCALPVIIAGNEGYDGIFYPLFSSDPTNLCGRSGRTLTSDALFSDISKLLSLPNADLIAMGQNNRAYIEKFYSESTMTDQIESIYETVV